MGEEKPAEEQTFVAWALRDDVKKNIFDNWREATELLYELDRSRVGTQNAMDERSFSSAGNKFKAAVLRLYRACRKKFKYAEKSKCVVALQALKLDNAEWNPNVLTFRYALLAFEHLTDFIELDGITKFEKKVLDPLHALVEEQE